VAVAGEIYLGGSGIACGYLNRDELTARRFIADPFSVQPNARLYKTGDLGRWRADGTIEYLGRNDQQVKIRGYRVEPGEIETHLLRDGRIRQVAVIAREDVPGDKRLVAYVVARDSQRGPTVEELRDQLAQQLPEYLVPAAIVTLDRLPLTSTGKVDRRALP